MIRPLIAALVALAPLPAAAQDAPPTANESVTWVKRDDPAMVAAIAEGRRTLPDFYRHLASPAKDEREFQIKFDITAGQPRRENIWARDVARDGEGLTGRLTDDAVLMPGKAGDRVRIPEASIVDWAYMKSGVMQGSFTTRALLDRIDPARAAALRKALGW